MALHRRAPSPCAAVTLSTFPARVCLQQLVTSVLAGMLFALLPLVYRVMVLCLGEPRVHSVMEEYWQHTLPEPYARREAARFAQYVRDQRLPVPHLDEVLAYEVASMDAVATGTAVQVPFSCDPRSIINPLRAGRRPGVIAEGRYELTVTP